MRNEQGTERNEVKHLPGELLICEVCGQQMESIAFDFSECREKCPLRLEEPEWPSSRQNAYPDC